MKTVKPMKTTKRLLTLTLLAHLSLGPTLVTNALADGLNKGNNRSSNSKGDEMKHQKIAADLRDRVNEKNGSSLAKVILQLNDKPSGSLNAFLASNGVKI